MGRKLRSPTLNKIDSYNLTRGGAQGATIADAEQAERMYNARSMLTTLESLSEWLAGIRGRRKAVVFVSEGIDYNIWDNSGSSSTSINGVNIVGRGDGIAARERDARRALPPPRGPTSTSTPSIRGGSTFRATRPCRSRGSRLTRRRWASACSRSRTNCASRRTRCARSRRRRAASRRSRATTSPTRSSASSTRTARITSSGTTRPTKSATGATARSRSG